MTNTKINIKKSRISLFSLILILLLMLVGCKKHETKPTISRTLIVYMGGDNNLTWETYAKIAAIAKANLNELGTPAASILIYQDPLTSSGKKPKLWKVIYNKKTTTSTTLEEIPQLQLLETYETENSADPETFARVIRHFMDISPSPSYGLLFFSHSSGWLPEGTLANPYKMPNRSVGNDTGREMELRDFAAAIPDHAFDFIIFESCLMSGVEVAYELKDKANYIVASSAEIVSPGFTPIYGDILTPLFTPGLTTLEALTASAQKFFDHANALSGAYQSATISVIQTNKLDQLADVAHQIVSNNSPTPPLSDIQHFDRNSYNLFFDFEQYFSKLATDEQRVELSRALSDVVLYHAATEGFFWPPSLYDYYGFLINNHSGLTTYIPQPQFPFLNEQYKLLLWYKAVYQ